MKISSESRIINSFKIFTLYYKTKQGKDNNKSVSKIDQLEI